MAIARAREILTRVESIDEGKTLMAQSANSDRRQIELSPATVRRWLTLPMLAQAKDTRLYSFPGRYDNPADCSSLAHRTAADTKDFAVRRCLMVAR